MLAHFQVSFLHVYHHASISLIWWMITYSAPGGDAYFSAALNSFVHVLMYCYYFTAVTLSASPNKKRQEGREGKSSTVKWAKETEN